MKWSLLQHSIFKNFLALSTLQGINMVLPFVTFPYLTNILGVSNYGVVVMIYSIMQLLLVICDFGFDLSATKEISLFREHKHRIDQIFSSVLIIKFFLVVISFLLLVLLSSFVDVIANYRSAYFLGFGIVIGQAILPTWLFQGLEQMKYLTIINLISKSVFASFVFIVIKEPEDYKYVPLLYSIGFILSGIISLYIAFKKFHVKFYFIAIKNIVRQLKSSKHYFFSRISVALYTSSNNFIAGLIFGEFYAGIFGVAEKLYTAMTLIYVPLSNAMYPFMVKTKKIKLFKKIFFSALIFNVIVCLITFLMSKEIVLFVFGHGYTESAILLKYFCFLAFFTVPVYFLGYPLLGAFGFEKYANYSVVVASVLHCIFLALFYKSLTIYTIIVLLIFTQIVVLSIRLYGVKLFRKRQIALR